MTLEDALARLSALGSERMRDQYARDSAYSPGVTGVHYGVKLGDIRTVAKAIKADHPLALALWETGIFEARLLAILIMKPKALSAEELDRLVRSNETVQVSDWLNSYVVKAHPQKEALREIWMAPGVPPIAARAGWSLTAERIAKAPANGSDALDIPARLDRIERELVTAHPLPQWTMNNSLAAIGIHHPDHRARALVLGEALGVYRDYHAEGLHLAVRAVVDWGDGAEGGVGNTAVASGADHIYSCAYDHGITGSHDYPITGSH